MADQKIEMTSAELEKLEEELAERQARRPGIIDLIATARAHGDLSENAEYHSAREEQGKNEGRIQQLEAMIDAAVIVDVKDDGVVSPGKLVRVRYEGDDDPETYILGQRALKDDVEHEVLTPESPIGSALLGKKAGETAVAKIRDRDVKLEIVEVTTP